MSEQIAGKLLDDPCPECGGKVALGELCTHMACTTPGCPFEWGMCSGVWVNATEYKRAKATFLAPPATGGNMIDDALHELNDHAERYEAGYREGFESGTEKALLDQDHEREEAETRGATAERARLLKLAEEMALEAIRNRKGLRKQSTASQDLRVTAEALREFIRKAEEGS